MTNGYFAWLRGNNLQPNESRVMVVRAICREFIKNAKPEALSWEVEKYWRLIDYSIYIGALPSYDDLCFKAQSILTIDPGVDGSEPARELIAYSLELANTAEKNGALITNLSESDNLGNRRRI